MFNGLGMNLGNLSRLSNAETRSISPENVTGEKGKGAMSLDGLAKDCARDLGQGWKISPYIFIQPGETVTLAEIDGPGAIQQIWMTMRGVWRQNIIRFYWEDRGEPSVEVPVEISLPRAGEHFLRSLLSPYALIREVLLIAIGKCLFGENAKLQ